MGYGTLPFGVLWPKLFCLLNPFFAIYYTSVPIISHLSGGGLFHEREVHQKTQEAHVQS